MRKNHNDLIKILENNGYKLRIKHYHTGNSSRSQRHGAPFMTMAWIEKNHVPVLKAVSKCSRRDAPSRRVGREVAVGRVLKNAEKVLHV